MFIARSAARVRIARVLFLLLAVVPLAALVTWATHRRSSAHRESVRGSWQRALGMEVEIGSLEHLRPGVMRATNCRVTAPDGLRSLSMPALEVEIAATEVRFRLEQWRCDAAAATVLGQLVREWLERGPRYDRHCVVEVNDLAWEGKTFTGDTVSSGGLRGDSSGGLRGDSSGGLRGDSVGGLRGDSVGGLRGDSVGGLRVECVVQEGARAVRIVRRAPDGGSTGEVRVVREAPPSGRLVITATSDEPLPLDIVSALVSGRSPSTELGLQAVVTGRLDMVADDRGATGSASGRLQGVDLAHAASASRVRVAGTAAVDLHRLEFSGGRLEECELEWRIGSGRVEQRVLENLVSLTGCRPGPAFRSGDPWADRVFDAAAGIVRVDSRGFHLLPATGFGAALAVVQGDPLVEAPAGPTAVDRAVWLLAAPGTPYAPASGPGAWLLSIMPQNPSRQSRSSDEASSGQPSPRF